MKNLILVFLLYCSLVGTAQSQLYCRQYSLTDNGDNISFSTPICYVSSVQLQLKSNHRLTLITDSLTLNFIIVHRYRSPFNDTDRMLASVVGESEQIYSISSHTNKASHFFMSVMPIRWNERAGKIQGTAIEISNVEICKH